MHIPRRNCRGSSYYSQLLAELQPALHAPWLQKQNSTCIIRSSESEVRKPVSNFFNSYFYGKSGKKDFTEADLPANRMQLFRDTLRVRRGSMVGLNLLYLLFWIPAIVWTFMNLVQLYLAPYEDAASLGSFFHQVIFSYLLVLFPLVALTGPFNMGVSYVLRNWARDEHSFPFADFKSAVKANWKQGLVFGVISGLVPLVTYLGASFYMGMAESSPLFYLPLAVLMIAAALWYLSSSILPTMIVTYEQGFIGHLRNAALMTMAALPRAIGIRLATLAVPTIVMICALYIPGILGYVSAGAVALYAIILPVFNKFICASHANALCETYLNPKIAGARTGIGLRPENED